MFGCDLAHQFHPARLDGTPAHRIIQETRLVDDFEEEILRVAISVTLGQGAPEGHDLVDIPRGQFPNCACAACREIRSRPRSCWRSTSLWHHRYIRYADDTLLGFIGPREEAEEIKHKLTTFLTSIGLTLSEEKTLITHAREQRARFLGYDISVAQADAQHTNGRRAINGKPMLHVPTEVVTKWRKRVTAHNKPQHRKQLLDRSDYDIVMTYAAEFNGLVNYYVLAYDVSQRLHPLKYLYMTSLVNTLARKHNKPATWVYRRYKRKNRNECTAIVVEVPREGKKPLVAKFGHKPIRFDKKAVVSDQPITIWANRSQLVQRLLANQCELCGSNKNIQIHHIHKLKDLRQRYRGRPDPPPWVVKHIQLNRKTIVVYADCHQRIHAGTYDGRKLKQGLPES